MNGKNEGRVGRNMGGVAFRTMTQTVRRIIVVAQRSRDIEFYIAVVMDLMTSFRKTRDRATQIEPLLLFGLNHRTVDQLKRIVADDGTGRVGTRIGRCRVSNHAVLHTACCGLHSGLRLVARQPSLILAFPIYPVILFAPGDTAKDEQ